MTRGYTVVARSSARRFGTSLLLLLAAMGVAHAAPVLLVEQTALDFGSQPVGSTTAGQTITLKNTGTSALTIASVGSPGAPFALAGSTCATALAPNATCTATYTYAPTAATASTATSAIASDGGNASVALKGSGRSTTAYPITLSPTAMDFGATAIGTESVVQQVTVTNTSAATVSVQVAGGGTGSDDFSAGTTCGGTFVTLAAGASCYVEYAFTPSDAGPLSASTTLQLTLFDSGGNPTSDVRNFPIALAGNGIDAIAVSPATVNFGDVVVGGSSVVQQVTVTNNATSTVQVQVAGGGTGSATFTAGTTCGGSFVTLAAGASCYVEYGFEPTATGPATASTTLQITPFSGGSALNYVRNHAVTLSGNGVATAAEAFPVAVMPSALDFGAVAIGTTSAPQRVLVTNTSAGSVNVQVAGGGPSGDSFGAGTTCGGNFVTLAAGAGCYIEYTFEPIAAGDATATTTLQLTLFDAGGTSTGTVRNFPVTFAGNGFDALMVLPSALNFGDVAVGASAPTQQVRVINTAAVPLQVQVAGGGPSGTGFTAGTTCGGNFVTLAAGASCYIEYGFEPVAPGAANGSTTLQLTTYVGGVSTGYVLNHPVTFAGNGVGDGPALVVSPYALDFGPVTVGTTSPALTATVTNTGTATLTGLVIGAPSDAVFARTTTCGATLAAGASCAVNFTVTAVALGDVSASLVVSSAAGNATITVEATAVAAPPVTPSGPPAPIPTLSVGTLAMLVVMMGLLGVRARRRRA